MKKLIYFTLGNNLNYIRLADICIRSIYKNNYDGDLLFITNLKEELLNSIFFKKEPFFVNTDISNLLHSSSNKLKIYLFDKINDYDKIIYCDLDIIWLKTPDIIFDNINEDKIFLSEENNLMSDDFWGGKLLTQEEKQLISKENIKGLNAGIFAFNNNMIKEFQKIDVFFDSNVSLVNECLEQPFINTYVFRNKIYNTQMNKFVSHNGYNLKDYDGVLLHFAGGPGNYSIKYDKMKIFYESRYDDNI